MFTLIFIGVKTTYFRPYGADESVGSVYTASTASVSSCPLSWHYPPLRDNVYSKLGEILTAVSSCMQPLHTQTSERM